MKVFIEDIHVLAVPNIRDEYDEATDTKRRYQAKQDKIANAELMQQNSASVQDSTKSQGFAESAITKIVDNLQISVQNIHIRYEDSSSNPSHPFAMGFTLSEFSMVSTDGKWQPTFLTGDLETIHKLITLGSMGVYWNPLAESLLGRSPKDMAEECHNMIAKKDHVPPDLRYILKPVSGTSRVHLNKTNLKEKPKIDSVVFFEEISFVLNHDQYTDSLMIFDNIHHYQLRQPNLAIRPTTSVKETPGDWFKYGQNVILKQIRRRHEVWTWDFLKQRRDDRIAYIKLFKTKLNSPLSSNDLEMFNSLESKLSYSDIRIYRNRARQEHKTEMKNSGVLQKPEKSSQGWFSWAWGSSSQQAEPDEDALIMNDVERQQVLDAIGYDEKTAVANSIDMPREAIKLKLSAVLQKGSFSLEHGQRESYKKITVVSFHLLKSTVLQRTDSLLTELSLKEFFVEDGTTPNTLYPQIVRVKKLSSDLSPLSSEAIVTDIDDVSHEKLSSAGFFDLTFENNPLDNSADQVVTCKLSSIEIFWNRVYIETVLTFFHPPAEHRESIDALIDAASAQVEGLRNQSRAGWEYVIDHHTTINANLDIQAPVIVVPEDVCKTSSCFVLDSGHVSLTSDLVQQKERRELKDSLGGALDEEGQKRLDRSLRDRFFLKLESTQLLIGPTVEETLKAVRKDERQSSSPFHIIDGINVTFQIELSILPKATNVTKLRVVGRLPTLRASISDAKYKTMMKIINQSIPREDTPMQAEVSPLPRRLMHKTSFAQTDDLDAPHLEDDIKAAEKIPINENISQSEILEDDDDDDFEEASTGIEKPSNIHQKNFEFKFTVDELVGSLYKSSNSGQEDKLLVELVLQHFDLDFFIRPYDMVAEVLLKTFQVEDRMDTTSPPELRKLITSESLDVTRGEDKGSHLIRIKYARVQKSSPEYMTTYDGIEQNVDVDIATINVIMTQTSVLTLYDFLLTTFTSESQEDQGSMTEGSEVRKALIDSSQSTDVVEDKIRIKVDLTKLSLVLNSDGLRLATVTLSRTDIGLFVMGKTMRLGARLGNLIVLDDVNVGADEGNSVRQILNIQGEEMADFRFETFASDGMSAYPGHDMSIYLRFGSPVINFLEKPIQKILLYMSSFARMKALYDSARQAALDQATQLQSKITKLKFDVQMSTPIIRFPRYNIDSTTRRNEIIVELGEVFAMNKFVLSSGNSSVNQIYFGVRNIKLSSNLQHEKEIEKLDMIEDIDMNFEANISEHKEETDGPEIDIKGDIPEISLRLTQIQYAILLELSQSVPKVFATEKSEVDTTPEPAIDSSTIIQKETQTSERILDEPSTSSQSSVSSWSKFELHFVIPKIILELYQVPESKASSNIDQYRLSEFSLNNVRIGVRMITDGSMESEVEMQTFTVKDVRNSKTNQFRDIVPAIQNEGNQFTTKITMTPGDQRTILVLLNIDSPKVILAIDYLFALGDFAVYPSRREAENKSRDSSETSSTAVSSPELSDSESISSVVQDETTNVGDTMTTLNYRMDIKAPSILLIANAENLASEAILFSSNQIILSKQRALTLSVEAIGMFLCRMNDLESTKVRLMEDLGVTVSMQTNIDGNVSFTTLEVDIEHLKLQLSIRDVVLAISIFNQASRMLQESQSQFAKKKVELLDDFSDSSLQKLGRGTTLRSFSKNAKTLHNVQRRKISTAPDEVKNTILRREELKSRFEGVTVTILDEEPDLPIVYFSLRSFEAEANDWSSDVSTTF